jgi:hypothetical protein
MRDHRISKALTHDRSAIPPSEYTVAMERQNRTTKEFL